MRTKRAKFAHPKYTNLYKYPDQPCWIFRKYSSEKRKSFYCSTGLTCDERNAPAAYKVGVERFNQWLGEFTPTDGSSTIQDLGRIVITTLDDPSISDHHLRSTRIQIEKHVIPAFGHLKPRQLTEERWAAYQRAERTRQGEVLQKDGTVRITPPRTKLYPTRKALLRILLLAKDRGLIKDVPALELADNEPPAPRYIPKETVMLIIRFAGRVDGYQRPGMAKVRDSRQHAFPLKLLVLIAWKQGARPGEILQYRWDMLNFDDGEFGTITIPAKITKNKKKRDRQIPLNPSVSRVLKFLESRRISPDWIFPSPTNPGKPMSSYKTAWSTVMRRLGLDFHIYNLRDTFITDRLREGFSSVFIAKYVQNSAAIIEKRYAVAERGVMEGVAGVAKRRTEARSGDKSW